MHVILKLLKHMVLLNIITGFFLLSRVFFLSNLMFSWHCFVNVDCDFLVLFLQTGILHGSFNIISTDSFNHINKLKLVHKYYIFILTKFIYLITSMSLPGKNKSWSLISIISSTFLQLSPPPPNKDTPTLYHLYLDHYFSGLSPLD